MSNNCTKLDVINLGVAFGCTWTIGILLLGWIGWLSGWGVAMIEVLGSVYLGYDPTFWGTVIGGIWAFVDGFIGGIILAAIYNSCTCGKSRSTSSEGTSEVL